MNKTKIRLLIITALFSAIVCLLSAWAIPTAVVPITLSVFALFLVGALLSPIKALFTTLVYITLGVIGLPVFSNFTGGLGVLFGPTGGFILAYPLMAVCHSAIIAKEKRPKVWFLKNITGMCLSLIICYLVGCVYYMLVTDVTITKALLICVIPFVLFDVLKLIGAAIITMAIFKSKLYNMLRK